MSDVFLLLVPFSNSHFQKRAQRVETASERAQNSWIYLCVGQPLWSWQHSWAIKTQVIHNGNAMHWCTAGASCEGMENAVASLEVFEVFEVFLNRFFSEYYDEISSNVRCESCADYVRSVRCGCYLALFLQPKHFVERAHISTQSTDSVLQVPPSSYSCHLKTELSMHLNIC